MENYVWIEWLVWLGSFAIGIGIFKQKQSEHGKRITELEKMMDQFQEDHRRIELTIASIPTKDDFAKLSQSIQSLQVSMVRVETILSGFTKRKDD